MTTVARQSPLETTPRRFQDYPFQADAWTDMSAIVREQRASITSIFENAWNEALYNKDPIDMTLKAFIADFTKRLLESLPFSVYATDKEWFCPLLDRWARLWYQNGDMLERGRMVVPPGFKDMEDYSKHKSECMMRSEILDDTYLTDTVRWLKHQYGVNISDAQVKQLETDITRSTNMGQAGKCIAGCMSIYSPSWLDYMHTIVIPMLFSRHKQLRMEKSFPPCKEETPRMTWRMPCLPISLCAPCANTPANLVWRNTR